MAGILDGRVAVVTGAGRGIGRAHAIALAAEGAKVVVNDLGVAHDGSGASKTLADEVVHKIRSEGGVAVASYDSVTNSKGTQGIIKTALDNYGRLDIFVNNAGIFLKDRMILEVSDDEWDSVVKVHLYGTFYCTRAACRVMKEQGYGRIINTSSSAGLGMLGQVDYSSAKEGIIGLTRTVAKDVMDYGVTCNAIRPVAGTRMALGGGRYEATIEKLGAEQAEQWKRVLEAADPADISPLVVYLASEAASSITGCVFDIREGYIAIYDDPPRLARTILKPDGRWLTEELRDVVPDTLTQGLEPIPPTIWRRLSIDSKGWEWSDGKLTEVQAEIK